MGAASRRRGSHPYESGVERKLATVLFVNLVESTALVSQVDHEIARRRVNRFFDQVSRCIQRHGETVEKFARDARGVQKFDRLRRLS